ILLKFVHVEGTFPDGTKLITVHDPVSSENGNLDLALHDSFFPIQSLEKFPIIKEWRGLQHGFVGLCYGVEGESGGFVCWSMSRGGKETDEKYLGRKGVLYVLDNRFRQVEADNGTTVSKPDPSEMKKIEAEGILTCLQDAIDSLNKGESSRSSSSSSNMATGAPLSSLDASISSSKSSSSSSKGL
nr:urease isoform X1 [Tanacetum cinerariifolium]